MIFGQGGGRVSKIPVHEHLAKYNAAKVVILVPS